MPNRRLPAVIDRRYSTTCLIRREAIQQARAAGADQIGLAATPASMSGVPRAIIATLFIGVTKLNGASAIRIARVVAARVIHAIGVRAAIGC